jgi:hypothetical protein
MKRIITLALSLMLVAAGSLLAGTSESLAHERRTVQGFNFVVGWLSEPALLNEPNAVDLRVTRASDTTPVTGLDSTLKVEVTSGSDKVTLDLRPRFNVPGAYDGRALPTRVGAYSFRFFGTIEGTQINETFTASPTTFGLIEEPKTFPEPLVSNQELAQQLNLIEERMISAENGDGGDDNTLPLVLGGLGMLLGGAALAVGLMRRPA